MPKKPEMIMDAEKLKEYDGLSPILEKKHLDGRWHYSGFFDKRDCRKEIEHVAMVAQADVVLCTDKPDESCFYVGFYRKAASVRGE